MILKKHLQDKPERHPSILSETSLEWSLLLDCIHAGYCNMFLSAAVLFRSFSLSLIPLSENQIAVSEAANGGVL